MTRLIAFNKPFGVLSQFTDKGNVDSPRATLSDYIDVPDVYAAGRLDRDSEGLMLLTDNGKLQARITAPKYRLEKTYLVQVEGMPDQQALSALTKGVRLKDGLTAPAKARAVNEPDWLWPRIPPIRTRKTIPDSWIELTISEGRNRQVRRMCAAVGFPCLRLIRVQIGPVALDALPPGDTRELDPSLFRKYSLSDARPDRTTKPVTRHRR